MYVYLGLILGNRASEDGSNMCLVGACHVCLFIRREVREFGMERAVHVCV